MRNAILAFIDFFYPPFKRLISLHNFRYLITGGSAAAVGILAYTVAFKYIFLGSGYYSPMWLAYGFGFMLFIVAVSVLIFNKVEKSFMDTV